MTMGSISLAAHFRCFQLMFVVAVLSLCGTQEIYQTSEQLQKYAYCLKQSGLSIGNVNAVAIPFLFNNAVPNNEADALESSFMGVCNSLQNDYRGKEFSYFTTKCCQALPSVSKNEYNGQEDASHTNFPHMNIIPLSVTVRKKKRSVETIVEFSVLHNVRAYVTTTTAKSAEGESQKKTLRIKRRNPPRISRALFKFQTERPADYGPSGLREVEFRFKSKYETDAEILIVVDVTKETTQTFNFDEIRRKTPQKESHLVTSTGWAHSMFRHSLTDNMLVPTPGRNITFLIDVLLDENIQFGIKTISENRPAKIALQSEYRIEKYMSASYSPVSIERLENIDTAQSNFTSVEEISPSQTNNVTAEKRTKLRVTLNSASGGDDTCIVILSQSYHNMNTHASPLVRSLQINLPILVKTPGQSYPIDSDVFYYDMSTDGCDLNSPSKRCDVTCTVYGSNINSIRLEIQGVDLRFRYEVLPGNHKAVGRLEIPIYAVFDSNAIAKVVSCEVQELFRPGKAKVFNIIALPTPSSQILVGYAAYLRSAKAQLTAQSGLVTEATLTCITTGTDVKVNAWGTSYKDGVVKNVIKVNTLNSYSYDVYWNYHVAKKTVFNIDPATFMFNFPYTCKAKNAFGNHNMLMALNNK